MVEETRKDKSAPSPSPGNTANKDAVENSGTGTEAKRLGGVDAAKRQAQRDWEDSAKESGD